MNLSRSGKRDNREKRIGDKRIEDKRIRDKRIVKDKR